MIELLSNAIIHEKLKLLSNSWSQKEKFLICKYEFKNFIDALDFMNKIGEKCEAMDHHPKWINVYNKIEVELFTHDSDGLTEKDFTLAKEMDNLFKNYE
mgnify:FL=1|tara:strand:- start:4450 stop:4746 length:297 start_codon:yes stop_codon:yes gene_type:complete